jgi:hypothetical protein
MPYKGARLQVLGVELFKGKRAVLGGAVRVVVFHYGRFGFIISNITESFCLPNLTADCAAGFFYNLSTTIFKLFLPAHGPQEKI